MRKFRIKKELKFGSINPAFVHFHVQMKVFWFWITIMTYVEEDQSFALRLAEDLLEELKNQ